MKRIRIHRIVLWCVVLLCLSGIKPVAAEEPKNSCEDWNQNYITRSFNVFAAEAENGYYFIASGYLYYMDFDMEMPIVLCNKPNCMHEGETCNAYLCQNGTDQIIYYEGAVYAFETVAGRGGRTENLLKISADGETREIIFEVTNREKNYFLIHRGKAYYIQRENKTNESVLISYDLKKQEEKIVYEGQGLARFHSLFIWENYLYFAVTEVDETDALSLRTMRCDLEDGDVMEIVVTDPETKEEYTEATPTAEREIDGKIYFLDRTEEMQYLLVADPEGGEAELAIEYASLGGISVMDDQYLYTISTKEQDMLSIYTLDGELMNEIEFEEDEKASLLFACMAGGSESTAFIYTEMFTETEEFVRVWKLDKDTIGTKKCHMELLIDTEGKDIIRR